MKKFYDTSALMNMQESAFEEPFYICSTTLEELERIKTSSHKDADVKYKARAISRLLKSNQDIYTVKNPDKWKLKGYENDYEINADFIIVFTAKCCGEEVLFVTDDLSCENIARSIFRLNVCSSRELLSSHTEYVGYLDLCPTDEQMAKLYNEPMNNQFGLLTNQYLICRTIDGYVSDKFKWDGEKMRRISYRAIDNSYLGKIKPRNIQQELAFDMLQDPKTTIKVLTGRYGSGKDFLMVSNAVNLVSNNRFDKIVWVRNNIEVKGTKPIGFLPDGMKDKLLPFAMPLADHLGGEVGLESYIRQGKIEIQHLGFIRGRDIRNAIILCSESENMTKEHIQLLVGRVGEGSSLWLNGDFQQVDEAEFEHNSGLTAAIEKFKGNPLFSFVKLEKTERSETAAMADILD